MTNPPSTYTVIPAERNWPSGKCRLFWKDYVSAGAPGSGPCSSIPLTIPLIIPLKSHEIQRFGAIILAGASFLI
ncbi:hypothetical protein BJX62DRAFT_193477 [Aspergillus germanicus]